MNNWSLYLLENTFNKKTYLGVTVNIERRIRQHNGELVGGARYNANYRTRFFCSKTYNPKS